MQKLVSVIVVNWNGRRHLGGCLSSLRRQTYLPLEVILVDNGSTDGSVEFVRRNFPEVKVIVNKRNLGFAEGNNVGIRKAKGEYIALLNNDTKADRRWLEELVKAAGLERQIGMCASKMLFFDRPEIINSAGFYLTKEGLTADIGFGEEDAGKYDNRKKVFGACAGAALYKREMLDGIGLFDGDYFAYLEDVDLGWRAQLSGWQCLYVPTAVVYHKHSATAREGSPFKVYHVERNMVWNITKNFPLLPLMSSLPWIIYGQASHLAYLLFIRKTPAAVTGKIAAFCRLGKMFGRRAMVQGSRKITDGEFMRLLKQPKPVSEYWRKRGDR